LTSLRISHRTESTEFMPSPPFVAIPVAAEETLGWAGLTRQHRTAQPRSRL